MSRITKKLCGKQYILKDMRDFPLCVYMFSKEFREIRKQVNKLGKLEDEVSDIIKKLENSYEYIFTL